MSDQKIHPIVLSGGMGTRLWPMSRVRQPKQLQPVDGIEGPSFLQDTVLRHRGAGYHRPLMVASASEEALIFEQLAQIDMPGGFVGEPMGRNTGPAVLAAALHLAEQDPEAVMLVLPSDHRIAGDLDTTLAAARQAASEGAIVLIGIVPRSPETGFGYITGGEALPGHSGVFAVDRFVEKPDLAHAEALLAAGGTFWASGISMMRADVAIAEFERHAPETLAAVRAAFDRARNCEHGIVLDGEGFAQAENEPTERLVFERSDRVAVAPSNVDWNDVGAWTAIHSIGEKSSLGNVETGQVVSLETRNSLIRAGSDKLVTVIGMEDLIVIDTPDALLVTNHAHAQMVKEAVTELKDQNRSEVFSHREAPSDRPEAGAIASHEVAPGDTLTVTGAVPGGAILAVVSGDSAVLTGAETGAADPGVHVSVPEGESVMVENHGKTDLRLVTIDLAASTAPARPADEDARAPQFLGRASA
ncbi:mannose-1-phosphate guanylyltransferase [Salipiger mucosus]|uniref:Mannose-1-phosphate guanylyltransferase (GDP) n=1 Tax=Salipiger mucosus DSM 16094 TaxID=1123237 RepID=S9S729_9RHOB|nr:sugar phosphate nucleotidyltransferase [Salipiger mucosus]EPX86000.1 Mannose-1-phosphate guanylyltransferase (GDP) [Salipiger mucosus DSM 16094]